MKTISRLALVLFVVAPTTLLAGCSNIGDTNPTSPEKMEQVRQKMDQERSNFKPSDTQSPGANSSGR